MTASPEWGAATKDKKRHKVLTAGAGGPRPLWFVGKKVRYFGKDNRLIYLYTYSFTYRIQYTVGGES